MAGLISKSNPVATQKFFLLQSQGVRMKRRAKVTPAYRIVLKIAARWLKSNCSTGRIK